jgi:3-deoxy-D-manno-octulosonate 8-phosphate phosphatase (KDO 8-P phosphatase)
MKKIKLFVMDVDGTMTDGKLYIGSDGDVMKAFNIKDGQGIKNLLENNIIPVIVTAKNSTIVKKRAEELGITEVRQGVSDKALILKEIAQKYAVPLQEIAYIGDDDNDIDSMKIAGVSFAPSDASRHTLDCARVVLSRRGGDGAVREAIDMLLEERI